MEGAAAAKGTEKHKVQPGAATGQIDNKQMALSNGSFIGAQCGFQLLIFHDAWIESLNFLTIRFIKD